MNQAEPDHIGKYAIQATLGKGAMGVVYQGYDAQIDRVVAIKTIRKAAFSGDELDDAMDRFKREAQAAGRLVHPNIVTVYEYGEEDDTAFIAMEFVKGRSLKELVSDNKDFSVRAIRTIISQLLAGLQYAHTHGVIHRDIKLENILLTHEGKVKIMDFGIARVESSSLTSVGTFMGTPAYMAPELFEDREVDGRSDLFAVGVILYQLICGEKPFRASTMTAIMHQVMSVAPAEPSALVADLPAQVDGLLAKALAKYRNKRFCDGKEFALAVQKALAGLDGQRILGTGPKQAGGGNDATIYQSTGPCLWPRYRKIQKLPLWQQGLVASTALLAMVLLIWLLAGGSKDSARPQTKEPAPQMREIKAASSKKKAPDQENQSPQIRIIAPETSKRKAEGSPPTAPSKGIAVTSKPYQQDRAIASGISITVPGGRE